MGDGLKIPGHLECIVEPAWQMGEAGPSSSSRVLPQPNKRKCCKKHLETH